MQPGPLGLPANEPQVFAKLLLIGMMDRYQKGRRCIQLGAELLLLAVLFERLIEP